NEMWSVFGLLYGERLSLETGSFEHLVAWEPVLQALWFDRPIYAATESSDFVGRDGKPLSLTQSFTLDDDADEMAHFLQTCGYLVLRNVFSAEEIAAMNEVVEREQQSSTPDDKRSWWATDSDGNEVCCRVTYLAERDQVFADLAVDDRLKAIAALSGAQLLPCPDRLDGLGVVIKNPSVVEGLSDLPWHRDCGMGGHFVLCPGLNVGVQLDEASAENGQLWFLAGSHHHAAQSLDMSQINGLPTVAVDAQPGDVTVHFGHLMHAAPPPSSPTANRKAVYVGFHVPELFDVIGPGQAYNDVLFTHGDGRVRSVEEASTGN
ncbi:MAG: phytanoyl-CoA dioxygenase family protein, partial [Actinomycetota bacterium]